MSQAPGWSLAKILQRGPRSIGEGDSSLGVVCELDAVQATAARVAATHATEVEPGLCAGVTDRFEPASAAVACDHRDLPVPYCAMAPI
jgi:hypothetical protein